MTDAELVSDLFESQGRELLDAQTNDKVENVAQPDSQGPQPNEQVALNEALTYEQAALYLERIGMADEAILLRENLVTTPHAWPLSPSLELLNKLVMAHLVSVPFESIDLVGSKHPINLGTQQLFNKIVSRRRGGYCFELNKSFNSLLKALGFTTRSFLGRAMLGYTGIKPRLHRVNVVDFSGEDCQGTYLVEVGYGGPVPAMAVLLCSGSFTDPFGVRFRLTYGQSDPQIGITDQTWLLTRIGSDDQDDLTVLSFEEMQQFEVDFIAINYYCSTAPDAYFRKNLVVNLSRTDGYVSITNDKLKLVSTDKTIEQDISDARLRTEALKNYFGIVL
ncbi:MAG: arylamine N-acetyltransferase [Coriobacteriales bacterium]|nr:arylamine N-acetyltransferase [Coriobacteriales bacterium]